MTLTGTLPVRTAAAVSAEAFFLPMSGPDGGQRFCVHHPAATTAARGQIVYVHPFAEEMNKSRRMAALQSRALAQAGYGVLQIDLHGCGDSSGDFGDARWTSWVDDVVAAAHWLQARTPAAPLWLWGLRGGCLVALDAARRLAVPCRALLWQPAASGKVLLQQFLRLKLAAEMASGQGQGVTEALKQELAAGRSVDVAGYRLPAALAAGLEQATLQPPAGCARLEWLELSTRPEATPSPAAAPVLAAWQQAGAAVRSRVVAGPAFWQTSEIEEAPALLDATLAALQAPEAA